MEKLSVFVDVHGSCVSASAFKHIPKSDVNIHHCFSRNNIASAMMPPVDFEFIHGDLKVYTSDYSERCIKYALYKNTVPLLLDSNAAFLVVDFFDFCQPVAAYKQTTFSTYDYTYYNSDFYQQNKNAFSLVDFLELPPFLWYGYVDLYWEKMKKKFGDNIILVRLNCSRHYISRDNAVKSIPEHLLAYGSAVYNARLHALEDYFIEKYDPYVVDLSKYFLPDESFNPDTTPVHFEGNYELAVAAAFRNIIVNKPAQRYFDELPPAMVADFLDRKLSEEDFEKVWQESASPFCSDDFLGDICHSLKLEDAIANRRWLSSIYRLYDKYAGAMTSTCDPAERAERLLAFVNDACRPDRPASGKIPQFILFELLKRIPYLQAPVEILFDSFLKAFDSQNLDWIVMLKILRVLLPDNKSILYYELQYYVALEDIPKTQKYALNYKYGI